MASKITLTHSTGLKRTAYIGWSWTSFFFGGFPALFRGDVLGFFVWLVAIVCLSLPTAGLGGLVVLFVWPAIYNRWHARRIIVKGYQITGAYGPLEDARAKVLG